jgi:hypothetical protein
MSYPIYFSEKNIRGAWVVYGALGIKQYYGYTKAEAESLYKTECSQKLFVNRKGEC